jgi:hypothetical protein
MLCDMIAESKFPECYDFLTNNVQIASFVNQLR